MEPLIDITTVTFTEKHRDEAQELRAQLAAHEPDARLTVIHNADNVHGGYAAACNIGALHNGSGAPYVGFLNPDVRVDGPFARAVAGQLERPRVVITGNRFGKPARELKIWGCKDWVCGATFFVRRDWFEKVGGFCEIYRWSWEETDLVRVAQADGMVVLSKELPLWHASPDTETDPHRREKDLMFDQGRRTFQARWRK